MKTAEHAYLGLNQGAYKRRDDIELGENVSRTEVLFSNVAAQVMSWTDTEIVVRVPHRNLYGLGKRNEFFNELATGPLIVRRGSWDVQPDGSCCTPKKWLTLEAGTFTIEPRACLILATSITIALTPTPTSEIRIARITMAVFSAPRRMPRGRGAGDAVVRVSLVDC